MFQKIVEHIDAYSVTMGPRHHFFGYYDKCPWSANGKYLLALETCFTNRPPTPDDIAVIGLMDLANGNSWQPIAETKSWNWQQGNMLQWMPTAPNRLIIYNNRAENQFVSIIRDVYTGETRILPRPISAVSNDGKSALSLNFARLHQTRPGYGYAGLPDLWENESHPKEDGIYWMNLETGENRLIISLDQIIGIHHNQSMDNAKHWFNHPQFNTDDTRFLFLHRWKKPGQRYHQSRMFTANLDGSEIYCVAEDGVVSHTYWRNSQQILAWANQNGIGEHYFLFTDLTDKIAIIGKYAFEGDGHCSYSPDRYWILTDTYPNRKEHKQKLFLYHAFNEFGIEIGNFVAPKALNGEIRCDLHPRWSCDGKKVCFDSTHEGTRQVYVVDVAYLLDKYDDASLEENITHDKIQAKTKTDFILSGESNYDNIDRQVLATYYKRHARQFLIQGYTDRARTFIKIAIRNKPLSVKSWVYLILTFANVTPVIKNVKVKLKRILMSVLDGKNLFVFLKNERKMRD